MSDVRILAGVLVRRSVRRALTREGFRFDERKSLLDSVFVVRDLGESEARALREWVSQATGGRSME